MGGAHVSCHDGLVWERADGAGLFTPFGIAQPIGHGQGLLLVRKMLRDVLSSDLLEDSRRVLATWDSQIECSLCNHAGFLLGADRHEERCQVRDGRADFLIRI